MEAADEPFGVKRSCAVHDRRHLQPELAKPLRTRWYLVANVRPLNCPLWTCVQTDMVDFISEQGQAASTSVADYVEATYGYRYSFRWPALGIALAYVLLLRGLVIAVLKWKHR